MVYRTNPITMLLDCTDSDVEVLQKVGYDWNDILKNTDLVAELNDCKKNGRSLLQLLLTLADEYGIDEIADFISDRLGAFEEIGCHKPLTDEEFCERAILEKLDPYGDIEYDFDKGPRAYFTHYESIYRRYMADAIEAYESGTGWKIENHLENKEDFE